MSFFASNKTNRPNIGLVLTGGGAKAAYQVGVLKGIGEVLREQTENPFRVIAGASAGAINGTILACHAHQYQIGLTRLEHTWANFHVEQVYEVHWGGLLRNTKRWLGEILRSADAKAKPVSLLISQPLRGLLRRVVPFDQIQQNIAENHLQAVSVTAYGYQSGESVSFFQSHENQMGWKRYRRGGVKAFLSLNHLMASSAIPMVFPAARLHREYFGDGSVGVLSPISPALHLGADRILVIATDPPEKSVHWRKQKVQYPSIAQISGRLMDSIFTDSLAADLERLERINSMLDLIPGRVLNKHKLPLRKVETLSFSPSIEVDILAAKHFDILPGLLRFFLNRAGISAKNGSEVLSMLMFEALFTRELISLGYEDALNRVEEIQTFFQI